METIHSSGRYFLYARKSTDTEEKQVRSIDDQLAELHDFAKSHNLNILETFIERRTAKIPGRPVFNEMLDRIQRGEADGILAWHPDRLSRNSIDGGRLIYLVDQGVIRDLKFPIYTFDSTSQGKFTLAIAFGQSKYYVDNLSENVKRAMRQKAKSGQFPGRAPVGYLNDPRTRTVVLDPARSHLVRKVFELFATGQWSIRELRATSTKLGLLSSSERPLSLSEMHRFLRNPFYYGLFRYAGELYEGRHEPLIAKSVFDRAQLALSQRTKPRWKPSSEKLFQGVFRCAACGAFITTETQKGRNYLRCTRKKGACSQPYLREDDAVRQMQVILSEIAVPQETVDTLRAEFTERKKQEATHRADNLFDLHQQSAEIDSKLERLTISYLDNIVTLDEYRSTKAAILLEKTKIKDETRLVEQHSNGWLEPMEAFIAELNQAISVVSGSDLREKRDFLTRVGSNLIIQDRTIHYDFQPLWKYVATEARKWRSRCGLPPEAALETRETSRISQKGCPMGIEPISPGPQSSVLTVELWAPYLPRFLVNPPKHCAQERI